MQFIQSFEFFLWELVEHIYFISKLQPISTRNKSAYKLA